MRNLKRALSLALATVMTLGLMVVGTGAVGYDDVTSEDNQEAIEVLQEVGIMTGVTDDEFNPDGLVTRNQMAVIMSQLLNLDYDYYRGINTFTDVPTWAAPYVAACVAEGVTAGIGNNLYGGENNVTAAQAALMLMKALGYFQYQEDFNPDWQVATIRQGSYINLFDLVDANAEEALTRSQVAQMVLNALKANMVDFTGDVGTQLTLPDGTTYVSGYKPEYTARTNAAQKYNKIDTGTTNIAANDQYYVQLGEELYEGDLELRNSSDDFGRPARYWEYDGDAIGTYVKDELLREEYTEKVTGEELYDLLGKTIIDEYDLVVYIDGVSDDSLNANVFGKSKLARTYDLGVGATGNGVLTQVFFDKDDKQITITSINTYLALVEDDYDEDKEELKVDIYASGAQGNDDDISVEEVAGIEGYVDGDMIMVQVAYDGRNYNIVDVLDPEVIEDATLTKYSENKYVICEGATYEYSFNGKISGALNEIKTYGEEALSAHTYNLYLDQYGNLIGNEEVTGSDNYVFITGYNFTGSATSISFADASAIFPDGTMDPITVNVEKTQENIDEYNYGPDKASGGGDDLTAPVAYPDFDQPTSANTASQYNRWFTYTTAQRNGETVYTLDPVDYWLNANYASAGEINSYTVRLNGSNGYDKEGGSRRAYGDDDSVYITVDTGSVTGGTEKAIKEINGVYTGVQDVDINVLSSGDNGLVAINGHDPSVFVVYDSDHYIIAAVVIGEDTSSTTSYGYILGNAEDESYESSSNYHYWSFEGVLNGAIQTLTIRLSDMEDFKDLQAEIQGMMNNDDPAPRAENGFVKFEFDTEGYVIGVDQIEQSDDGVYQNSDVATGTDPDPDDYNAYLVKWGYWPAGTPTNQADFVVYNNKHTLYNQNSADDPGLTLDRDGTVVVIEAVKYTADNDTEVVWTEYDNLEDAIESLKNPDSFTGYVAAALNEKGTAEWIVLNSNDMKTETTDGGEGINDDYAIEDVRVSGDDVRVFISNGSTENGDIADADTITLQAWTTGQGYTDVGSYDDVASSTYVAARSGHRFDLTDAVNDVPGASGDTVSCRVIVEIDGVTLTSGKFTVTVP